MQCPRCKTRNPEGARFCLNCGTRLARNCPHCGLELPPQAKFCLECGAQAAGLPSPAVPTESRADRTAGRLRCLVPKETAAQLTGEQGTTSRERRTVTILFSDIKGSTALAEELDPEEWLEIMDGAFDVLIEPVIGHEGTVARLMGDAILAFFGAPTAHEDDPERACKAALDIIAGAQDYALRLERERGVQGFNVRVGINTGLVVVGEVGSDLQVEYTAMGDAVNLASRLEQNAPPGGILISHDTYRHVRGVFDVQPQQILHVKGRSEAVPTYLVERAKPRAFRKLERGVEGIETHMVGREAELKRLQDAFYTAMEDGALQMVTVCGEAGVGKSRLLYEFDLWSELLPEQFYYFKGRAAPEMQGLPHSLIRDLLAFRFQIQDSDDVAVVREKLEAGFGEVLGHEAVSQPSAHLVGRFAGFEMDESAPLDAPGDDPQRFRDGALRCLAEYLQCAARRLQVLILLEDLHWADDSSLDVLNELAQALVGDAVMVVCAARPALFERRPHWGEGQVFHSRLALEPLSRWDSRRLVAEILQKVEDLPDSLRDQIVQSAEGSPFFIEELIKMLIEDGSIVKGEDEWRLEPVRLTRVQVPPTLAGVLQARLDQLSPHERTVLQQASVAGRLFWDRVVVYMSQSAGERLEPAQVFGSLAALRDREMILQRETTAFAGAREYIFKHALLQEATYEGVLKRARRIYHGFVADWLIDQAGQRQSEYAGLIADHLALSGRGGEAVDFLLQAGDRARDLYAHSEAVRAYERALSLLKDRGDHHQAARTLMKLGLTHHNAFAFRQARQAYDEGFAMRQKAGQAPPAAPPLPAPHAFRISIGVLLTLDPVLAEDEDSGSVIEHLFSGLVSLTAELDIVPDLAQSWEVLEGGRKYHFHLRDNVWWSDGVPVTAHDFEYAWKRMLDPATGSSAAQRLYDVRAARAYHQGRETDPRRVGIHAPDAATLVVELERPTGYFLQVLPLLRPIPRHVVEIHGPAWTAPGNIVTNGPFLLEDWQSGERLVLVRNPRYHGSCSGNVDRVEVWVLPLEAWPRKLAMFENGDLDALETAGFPDPEVEALRRGYAGEYVSLPLNGFFYIAFNASKPPFGDARVRQAFTLAVDREALADGAFQGHYFPATGGLIPPLVPGHSPGISLPYDPGRARALLAEAGYPRGRGFPDTELYLWRGREPLGELPLRQWRENLGVSITLNASLEWASYLAMLDMEPPLLWLGSWAADYPDPDNPLRVGMRRWTRSCWQHDGFLQLVERARQLTDQTQRMALYREADRIAVEQAAVLPLVGLRMHLFVRSWVKGIAAWSRGYGFWQDVVIEPH